MNANVLVAKKGHISFFSERKAARENFRLTFTQTYVLAIMMIAFLGVYYVWILNQNATKGYNISKLQMTYKEKLFQENLLDNRIAEASSIDAIAKSQIYSRMENVDKPIFLVLKDSRYTLQD